MNNIIEVPFDQLLAQVIDNRGKTCPVVDVGIPLIATNCIKNDQLFPVFEKVRFVDEHTLLNWFRGHPQPGDIVFVTKGTPGRVAWVPDPVNFCIAQDMVALRVDSSKVHPKYLFAALRSSIIQGEIENLHVGSLIPHFKKGDFGRLFIPVPTPEVQEFIGDMYFTLSSKIDLLHRNNKTLEEMAETLFRQWFVEGAKEEWEVKKINTLGIYISDFVANGSFESLKKNTTLYPDLPNYALFIRNTDLKSGFTSKVYVDEHSYNFLNKTKLFGGEVIISNVADVGSVHLCPHFEIPMTLGNNVIMLNSNYNFFLYHYFKSPIGQNQIMGITSGSAQQKFNKTDFRNLELQIPDESFLVNFHNSVSVFHEKITQNSKQISSLKLTRDTLLPKLMSGQVRVGNN